VKRALVIDALVIALAFVVMDANIPSATIEHVYANGAFAWMNAAFAPLSNRVPFAVGDLEVILVLARPHRRLDRWSTPRTRLATARRCGAARTHRSTRGGHRHCV